MWEGITTRCRRRRAACSPRLDEDALLYRIAGNGEVVGYTPSEYGVRKDDGGGLVRPVNSAGGILFLALLLTACMGGLVYFVVQVAVQDSWHIVGKVWWVFPACIFPFCAAWMSLFKERRARTAASVPQPPATVRVATPARQRCCSSSSQ